MDPVAGVPNYYERDDDALTYLRIPVFDNAGENITPFIRDAVDFIDRAQFYGNVLVHCNKVSALLMATRTLGDACYVTCFSGAGCQSIALLRYCLPDGEERLHPRGGPGLRAVMPPCGEPQRILYRAASKVRDHPEQWKSNVGHNKSK